MASTPPPSTPNAPPGWYPDPAGSAQQRYWDGHRWTDALAAGVPPATGPAGSSSYGWAALAHLSALVAIFVGFVFVGPLVVYLLKKDDPFVRRHAAEALNFNLSVTLYAIVGGFVMVILIIFLVGLLLIPVAIAAGIAWFVLVIVAGLKANNGEEYRYPLTIRFVS
jgi:uncharacterized Tic20 family protein